MSSPYNYLLVAFDLAVTTGCDIKPIDQAMILVALIYLLFSIVNEFMQLRCYYP